MGFDSAVYPDDIDELCYNEVCFQFCLEGPFGKPIECCQVKKCGVRLMYTQDIGKPSESCSSGDEDEFLELALIRRKSNHTTQDPNLSSSLELNKPNSISILKIPMEVSVSVRRKMHHTSRD
ncbi:hypothetical protein Q3G72_025198 [Acer saccharum]|nr:hypothetical protein Q3G72_025198 [Acer saccharum]